jgi:hypothetical protein
MERDEPAPMYAPPTSGYGILTAQTSASIGVEIGIKTIAAVSQCR